MISALVSYPGGFTPPQPLVWNPLSLTSLFTGVLKHHAAANIYKGNLPEWPYIVIGVAFLVAVAGGLIWLDAEMDRSEAAADAGGIVAFLGVVGLIVGIAAAVTTFNDADHARMALNEERVTAAKTSYIHQVQSWLTADYGISADDASAWDLTQSGQKIARTNEGAKLIELRPTVDGSKAVYVVGGDVLPTLH